MAEFYVSDNKIYMDDGTVSLHIADLRPELTETLKAEVAENLEADRADPRGESRQRRFDGRRRNQSCFDGRDTGNVKPSQRYRRNNRQSV